MNFDSGWEWGYWLNDVVTARASWDPLLSPRARPASSQPAPGAAAACAMGDAAGTCASGGSGGEREYHERDDQWVAFATALQPVTRTFGPTLGPRLNALLVDVAAAQVQSLARLEMRRVCGGSLTSRHTNPPRGRRRGAG